MDHHRDIQSPWQLVCDDLRVERGKRAVLDDVRCTISTGECVSIIGSNGAGKTTLLQTMLGILPPSCGSVKINGRSVHRLAPRVRGRFAAYVPQTVERLPAFSVYDVVAGGRFPHTAPLRPLTDSDRQAIDAAIDACGLEELAARPVDAISGGERQKTLIAAAIAQDPQIMLLDEPTTALDPAVQTELVRTLRAWHARGRALIIVSHDLNLPAALGGRVLAMRAGRIVSDGPVGQVISESHLRDIFGTEFEILRREGGSTLVAPQWD